MQTARAQQQLIKAFFTTAGFLKIANSYIQIYQILGYIKCFVSPPLPLSFLDLI